MKKVFLYISIIAFLFILYGCPTNFLQECDYKYPIDIKILKDTIKTTDTLWVENDFDSRFCLENPVKNGYTYEYPRVMRLINDSLEFYGVTVINYTGKNEGIDGNMYYYIELREQNGNYKSKYGIVFPDTGIYSLSVHFGMLVGKLTHIHLSPYFNTPSNNIYLLPDKERNNHNSPFEIPYHYRTYFLAVVN